MSIDAAFLQFHAMEYVRRGWTILPASFPLASAIHATEGRPLLVEPVALPGIKPVRTAERAEKVWAAHPTAGIAIVSGDASPVALALNPSIDGSPADRLGRPADVTSTAGEQYWYFDRDSDVPKNALSQGFTVISGGRLLPAPPSLNAWGCTLRWTTNPR